jgi:perosamine synthetase
MTVASTTSTTSGPSATAANAATAARPDPRIRLARYDAGEEEVEAIRSVIASGFLTNGPKTAEFERVFAERHGVEHAVAFANGTVALQGLYLAAGIGVGDEVIVPSMTFISTATSVLHVGATPVFADVDAETYNISPEAVAAKITSRTKAIVPVHYGGQPADMDELRTIAASAGALVFEDAAEAHGASYRGRPVGGLGDAAMFSFTPTKNITTGEGGIITTGSAELAATMRLLRSHGQTALYEHAILGYNWRITELQAAMGIVQVGRLDAILARKRANAVRIATLLADVPGISMPVVRPDREHVYMLYTCLVDEGVDRDAALAGMLDRGVEARVYFPPAHRQPVFLVDGRPPADLPVTDELARRMLSVPFHSLLTDAELVDIVDTLREALVAAGAR